MSIWQDRGRTPDYDDFNDAQFGNRPKGGPTTEQLKQLIEKVSSSAAVHADETTNVAQFSLRTKLTINGSEYNAKVGSDGTFTATRADGAIEIKLFHDSRSRGQLKFSYRNDNAPDKSGVTNDQLVCHLAEKMGQTWFRAATNPGGSLDI